MHSSRGLAFRPLPRPLASPTSTAVAARPRPGRSQDGGPAREPTGHTCREHQVRTDGWPRARAKFREATLSATSCQEAPDPTVGQAGAGRAPTARPFIRTAWPASDEKGHSLQVRARVAVLRLLQVVTAASPPRCVHRTSPRLQVSRPSRSSTPASFGDDVGKAVLATAASLEGAGPPGRVPGGPGARLSWRVRVRSGPVRPDVRPGPGDGRRRVRRW